MSTTKTTTNNETKTNEVKTSKREQRMIEMSAEYKKLTGKEIGIKVSAETKIGDLHEKFAEYFETLTEEQRADKKYEAYSKYFPKAHRNLSVPKNSVGKVVAFLPKTVSRGELPIIHFDGYGYCCLTPWSMLSRPVPANFAKMTEAEQKAWFEKSKETPFKVGDKIALFGISKIVWFNDKGEALHDYCTTTKGGQASGEIIRALIKGKSLDEALKPYQPVEKPVAVKTADKAEKSAEKKNL